MGVPPSESEQSEEKDMRILNSIDIAEMVVKSSDGDLSIIVLDVHNDGSTSRWAEAFPSLDAEELQSLGEAAFLQVATRQEANDVFMRLTRDCAASGSGTVVHGFITLVTPHARHDDETEVRNWDLESPTLPVTVNHVDWTEEVIVDRL
jgi:hypothetical protein